MLTPPSPSSTLPARFLKSLILLGSSLLWLISATAGASLLVPPDADDGRTVVSFPSDPFLNNSAAEGGVSFLKFAIVLSEPGVVYFQDSEKYPFHYDFASQRLQPFLGMTRTQFDAVALRSSGQQVVLGALLYGYRDSVAEIGIQFVGQDAYSREQIAQWYETVLQAVEVEAGQPIPSAFYIPSYEQRTVAESQKTWFASQDITVSSIERWLDGDQIYSPGWALGRLVYVQGNQINAAYGDGRLRYDDILMTDGVPAEVPFVAGIVSFSPATPNSHVAILAKNQGVPFGSLKSLEEKQATFALNGKQVLLRVQDEGINHGVSVTLVDQDLDAKIRAHILSFKKPLAAKITLRAHRGLLAQDVTTLTPRDIRFFGGKAANFGFLRRTIPANSPIAAAFSFDLWEQYLQNTNPESGLTLQQEISARLGGFQWPPNIAEARPQLEAIRNLIRKKVKFTDAQKSAITGQLLSLGFERNRELRFRSSTNVEDSEVLTGAGLYESATGCLADSLDGNSDGPSICCPDEPKEQTVLDAIEKVFASFYNENAWLERLRHSIREEQAGMAILVHHNFPEEVELANGVVTLKRRDVYANRAGHKSVSFDAEIVSQLGEESVTNPSGGLKPEVVEVAQDTSEPYFGVRQRSNLVPLGGNIMTWEEDYQTLFDLLKQVAGAFAAANPTKHEFVLDFEFKKVRVSPTETKLLVKQVRQLGIPAPKLVPPYLLNEPAEFVVRQTEGPDVFANHRLKAKFFLETKNDRLTTPQLAGGLHKACSVEWLVNGSLRQLTNGPRSWPAYSFGNATAAFTDRWSFGARAQRTSYRLRVAYGGKVNSQTDLIFTQKDFHHTYTAIYTKPQVYLDGDVLKSRKSDAVFLAARSALPPQDTAQVRQMVHPGGFQIDTTFFWEKPTSGIYPKTWSLAAWEQTVISGLTTVPITLFNDYAQTYGPAHHNFSETFIFEPALDPGVTSQQKSELEAKNIQYIYVSKNLDAPTTWFFMGLDGVLRSAL